jgi:RHS repeat-associated protein
VTTAYSYNALGQRTSATSSVEVATYQWSGSRLSSLITEQSKSNFEYEGTGQRTSKTVETAEGQTTTSYVYDGLSLLALSEVSDAGVQSLTYLYGEGATPIGALYQGPSLTSPLAFEIVSDQRGDVRELRDTSGAAFARIEYDAYGNIRDEETFETNLISEDLVGTILDLQPLRYAGYVFDADTGLYYCSQRYYDPTIGAFISKDPIKSDGELSFYSYCTGDSINGVDPGGLQRVALNRARQQYAQQQGTQAIVNGNLNGGYYDVGGGYRKCSGHVLSAYTKPSTYNCSGCGAVFDLNGKFLGITEKEKAKQEIYGIVIYRVGEMFIHKNLMQDGIDRKNNAKNTEYKATFYEQQNKALGTESKKVQVDIGFSEATESLAFMKNYGGDGLKVTENILDFMKFISIAVLLRNE